jgi:type II secretory pathway pseudopilin PulG
MLIVTALVAVLATIAVPQVLAGVDGSRTRAAARFLSARMALARMQAVARGANVGLQFSIGAGGVRFATYVDGDDDGVRTADIAAGIDSALDPPVRLSELFPGVDIGLTINGLPGDPVQVGVSNILSFSPIGTATSGTVYIRGRDGAQQAVRVLGATARTRVLRYDAVREAFVETY